MTKYKANRSFVEWSQTMSFTPLEYDNIGSFTGELFENYMEYKQLLKLVQDILLNRDQYAVQTDKHNAISTDVATLIAVRSALRSEMNKIVEAVDVLARDPGILKRQKADATPPKNSTVRSILLEARYGRFGNLAPSDTPPTTGDSSQEDQVALTLSGQDSKPREFDFASLVAPEIWLDHMPTLKNGAVINPSKPSDTTAPLGAGFPPPPSKDPQEDVPGSTTTKPEPKPEPITLTIHAASWGGVDVTSYMSRFIDADKATFTIDLTDTSKLGIPDPWPDTKKSLSVLFRYSNSVDMYVLLASDGSGVQRILPTSNQNQTSNIARVGMYPVPPRSEFDLIAVIWGDALVTLPSVYDAIYAKIVAKEPFPVTNEFLGGDPWPGIVKSCAIYYFYGMDRVFRAVNAREYTELSIVRPSTTEA